MRVKYKQWAVDYLDESKLNQFNLENEDREKISSFIREKETYVEIGPGKGEFILDLAAKNPDKNFIVIELNKTISGICLKKIDESKLENVKLVAGDFYKFADQIEKESITGIFLNFSDPWPKRKHENRRLTCDKFLSVYYQILKKNGIIYQKTDNYNFYMYSRTQFDDFEFNRIYETFDYLTIDEFDAETEYEHKFKGKGTKINRAIYLKDENTLSKRAEL